MFDQAHVIEVWVRYLETRKEPVKVKVIERVLRDRRTFGQIQEILLAHAAEAQAVEPWPGYSASSYYVWFGFKDSQGRLVASLDNDDERLVFKPGGDFEVDKKISGELIRLFVLHGERVK